MALDTRIDGLLKETLDGRPITLEEAECLLSFPEDCPETALLRTTANLVSRRKFGNKAVMLGQIGVDMAPCSGDCAFCFFAKSHTSIQASVLPNEEVITRCKRFAEGGAQGIFLMTMHRFGFEWFCNLCSTLRGCLPAHMQILANVGDLTYAQLQELQSAGVTGAYHVCRLREGVDSCMSPSMRRTTVERIIKAGLEHIN